MKGVPRFSLARVRCFQAQLGKENSAACGGFSLGLSLVATASNASLAREAQDLGSISDAFHWDSLEVPTSFDYKGFVTVLFS